MKVKKSVSAVALLMFAGSGIAMGQDPFDVILEWNAVALEANVIDHNGPDTPGELLSGTQGPPASARVLGMVHAAMFDAYNSVDPRCTPYLFQIADAEDASVEAAVAQAAHDVLLELIPAGAAVYSDALQSTLNRVTDGVAEDDGVLVGQQVAAAILTARQDDVVDPADMADYMPTGFPGNHDVDPENPGQSYISPEFGAVLPFVVPDIRVFRADRPPFLFALRYALAYYQVRYLGEFRGGESGAVPTDDETYVIANYWSYNGSPGTGTPPRLYNQIARVIAVQQGNTVAENARMFALINLSMADAGISAWDTKYTFNLWRPVLGIQNGHRDFNVLTIRDRDWSALGGSRSNPLLIEGALESNFSPPFPAYTSGHATFGAAALKSLANFYQDDRIRFTFVSDEWNGITRDQFNRVRPFVERSYDSLSEAAAENAASRVFNGVHWSFDGTEGVRAGNALADFAYENILLPVGGPTPTAIPNADFERQIDDILFRGLIQRITVDLL